MDSDYPRPCLSAGRAIKSTLFPVIAISLGLFWVAVTLLAYAVTLMGQLVQMGTGQLERSLHWLGDRAVAIVEYAGLWM